MREIIFRGKTKDTAISHWVYGDLIHEPSGIYIQYIHDNNCIKCEVEENTISEYTGYNDEYGNKMFENDIVICPEDGLHFVKGVIKKEKGAFIIEWENKYYCPYPPLKVIGNVFDIEGD